jgi:alanyl-tRNA synthetase
MGEFFLKLKNNKVVTNVIREESFFLRTLDQGLQLLDKVIAETGKEVNGAKSI